MDRIARIMEIRSCRSHGLRSQPYRLQLLPWFSWGGVWLRAQARRQTLPQAIFSLPFRQQDDPRTEVSPRAEAIVSLPFRQQDDGRLRNDEHDQGNLCILSSGQEENKRSDH